MRRLRLFALILLAAAECFYLARHFGSPRIVVAGSSGMAHMALALAARYTGLTGIDVEVQLGGTELGLQSLREGAADIAACSRSLGEAEADLTAIPVAVDAIAVAVNAQNPVSSLTLEQLRGIYAGELRSWSQLGGADCPIVVIGRESGSGTRTAFEEAIGLHAPARHGQELCETGMVRTAVSQSPGAIGYLSMEYLNDEIRSVSIDGSLPGQAGYPLTRDFLFCIKASGSPALCRQFLEFAVGDEGRRVIRALGMLPAAGEGDALP